MCSHAERTRAPVENHKTLESTVALIGPSESSGQSKEFLGVLEFCICAEELTAVSG